MWAKSALAGKPRLQHVHSWPERAVRSSFFLFSFPLYITDHGHRDRSCNQMLPPLGANGKYNSSLRRGCRPSPGGTLPQIPEW